MVLASGVRGSSPLIRVTVEAFDEALELALRKMMSFHRALPFPALFVLAPALLTAFRTWDVSPRLTG